MYKAIPNLRRLPLEGADNARDIGGYPCLGGITRWRVFLRSDGPQSLTQNDLNFLHAYGLRTIIDLRSSEECKSSPSMFTKTDRFKISHLPMSDQMNSVNWQGDVPGSMSGLYIWILDESSQQLAQVLRTLASAEGIALFHCAAGKDRTGVVAMLLLKLAGVSNADIIADYAVTEIYIRQMAEHKTRLLEQDGRAVPHHVFRSIPDSMHRTIIHLEEKYKTAENFMLSAGLSQAEIDILREKIVQKI